MRVFRFSISRFAAWMCIALIAQFASVKTGNALGSVLSFEEIKSDRQIVGLPAEFSFLAKGGFIHTNNNFVIIQNRSSPFCSKGLCLTAVIPNCADNICPYATMFSGRDFYWSDSIVSLEIDGRVVVELQAYCPGTHGAADFQNISNTFWVGKELAVAGSQKTNECKGD